MCFDSSCIHRYVAYNIYSKKKLSTAKSKEESQTQSYIKFGNYYQQNSDNKTPIEWIELERTEDTVLLMSRFGLDCVRFNDYLGPDVTWETCSLRKWLNETFYDTAFTAEEQARIVVSTVLPCEKSAVLSTPQGNATQDKVYIWGIDEVNKWNHLTLMTPPTEYAISRGADIWSNWKNDGKECGRWWLRTLGLWSPGYNRNLVLVVEADGKIPSYVGVRVNERGFTVRPVIRININT